MCRHFPKIGKAAIGEQIVDVIYDAWQCRLLAVDEDVERRKRTLYNADTYVWYALVRKRHSKSMIRKMMLTVFQQEIAFTEICGKDFSGVRDERDDDETNQDWPDNDATCDCNESGCTDESPGCCGSGTC
jgi:hypothetical protein